MHPLPKSQRQTAVSSGLRPSSQKSPEVPVAVALVGTPHRPAQADGQQPNRPADIISAQPLVVMQITAPEPAIVHLISSVLHTVIHTPQRLIPHTSYVVQQQSAEQTA